MQEYMKDQNAIIQHLRVRGAPCPITELKVCLPVWADTILQHMKRNRLVESVSINKVQCWSLVG